MMQWLELIMVICILTNLIFLLSTRLISCIRIVAFQGVLIGVLPIFLSSEVTVRTYAFVLVMIGIKGVIFPFILKRALIAANVRHEVETFIPFSISLVLGMGLLGFCFWLKDRLPLPGNLVSSLVVCTSFFSILSGLLVLITRVKALTQVLGYLVLENGIYLFGIALMNEQPFLVEFGILLDVFVAVFVMGIMIFHISSEFDHIDTHELSHLKDWTGK